MSVANPWQGPHAVAVSAPRRPLPPLSRLAAEARLTPAQVTVCGLDGNYSDPELLREAADLLCRMAQRLDAVKGGRS